MRFFEFRFERLERGQGLVEHAPYGYFLKERGDLRHTRHSNFGGGGFDFAGFRAEGLGVSVLDVFSNL